MKFLKAILILVLLITSCKSNKTAIGNSMATKKVSAKNVSKEATEKILTF